MSRPQHAAAASVAVDSVARQPLTERPKTLGKVDAVRAQIKRASRIGREIAGVSQRQLALALDTKRVVVAHFELDHQPRVPNADHLSDPDAPRAWRMEVLRVIADASQAQVVDRAEVVHGDNHFARLASITKETSEVLSVFSEHLADGERCENEAEIEIRHVDEAIAALMEHRAHLADTLAKHRANRTR